MNDYDAVWNAFISAIPEKDRARHNLQNFQAKLLDGALLEIEELTKQLEATKKDLAMFRDDWQAMSRDLGRWRAK